MSVSQVYFTDFHTPAYGDSLPTKLQKLLKKAGIELRNHADCGAMLFDIKKQDVHCGGSGCGCSASVLCGHLLRRMKQGELNRILFCATGALMSTTSQQQGESIPGVCHIVELRHQP